MNKELIKDLQEGRIAVKNDGTLEELNKVLQTAFPNSKIVTHHFGYDKYYNRLRETNTWEEYYNANLPYYSVKDFLKSKKYTIKEINNNKNILVIIKSENQFNKLKSLGLKLWSKYCGHYYYIPSTGALFHNDLKLKSNDIVLTYSDIIMNKKLNIKDYIGKKYVVECNSKKEWQAILDLAPDSIKSITCNYEDSSNKLIDLYEFGTSWLIAGRDEVEKAGYTILPVSDFLDIPTEKSLPRVMLVSDTNDIKTAVKRVVFAIKCGYHISWALAETIEQSEYETRTISWEYAWELDELTIFPFNLSPTDAQSIIDIACTNWKSKLAEKWAINIVKKESITISEQEYTEMYKACTDEQKELFDKIFK